MKWAYFLDGNRNLDKQKVTLTITGCEHGQDWMRPYVALKPDVIHK